LPINPQHEADRIAGSLDIDWSDLLDDIAFVLGGAATAAGKQVVAALGASDDAFDVVDVFGKDYAQRRGAELVGMRVMSDGTVVPNPNPEFAITETTRNMVRGKLAEAIESGSSVHELRTAIMDDVFGVKRALVISRTEISLAHNRGQLEGAKASGVQSKSWFDAGDEAECDECPENADEGPIDIGDDFTSGDHAPPAHPNCRCSLVYYPPDDE